MLSRGVELGHGHPLFEGVEAGIVRLLQDRGTLRSLPAGETITHEAEEAGALFILCRGAVQGTCSSPDGDELMTSLLHAPAVFGEASCLTGGPHRETVRVLERVIVLEVPRAVILEALRTSHALSMNLLQSMAAKLTHAVDHERALAFHPVERRLADLLRRYARLFGLPVASGTKIRVPLTQDELASALGVARRSVTRALQRWVDQGTVVKEGRYFILRNEAALEAAS